VRKLIICQVVYTNHTLSEFSQRPRVKREVGQGATGGSDGGFVSWMGAGRQLLHIATTCFG